MRNHKINNDEYFFNRSLTVYLILFAILILCSFPFVKRGVFSSEFITNLEREKALIDSMKIIYEKTIEEKEKYKENGQQLIVWDWVDFDGVGHFLKIPVDTSLLRKTRIKRNLISLNRFLPPLKRATEVYKQLDFSCDSISIIIANEFKNEIKKQNYNKNNHYIKSLELIVTAIQNIPYTLVLDGNETCPTSSNNRYYKNICEACPNGDGCCDDVGPFAVFSPLEFFIQKTGDCDTRSLFAFSVLSRLGIKSAVMVSFNEGHSVLGVESKGRSYDSEGAGLNGKKYALWELTAKGYRIGQGVKGNDWVSTLSN